MNYRGAVSSVLRFARFIGLLFCFFLPLLDGNAQTLGERVDPRVMSEINQEIARLQGLIEEKGLEQENGKLLLQAYDQRVNLFSDRQDPEGEYQSELLARRLLLIDPRNPLALYFSAHAAYREKKYDEVAELLKRISEEGLSALLHSRIQLLGARSAFFQLNFSRSVELATRAVSSPDVELVSAARGLLQRAKQLDEEKSRLEKRLQASPDNVETHVELAAFYLRPELGQSPELQQKRLLELEATLLRLPEYIPARLFLARSLMQFNSQITRAEKLCRQALAASRADQERKDAAVLLNEILMRKITGKGEN